MTVRKASHAPAPLTDRSGRDRARKAASRSGRVRRALAHHYRDLFESNPLPMWVYDLQTLRFLDVNEVACAKYGYTREEFLAMTILDIRPREDAAAVQASVRETPAHVFNSGVWRHRLKDGSTIFVEITSHELDYMGRRTRFVCPVDVTRRVQAEALAREKRAALRRAQGMARLAHMVTDPQGVFTTWSETLPGLAGTPLERMPRTTRDWIGTLVHPDDRARVRAASLEAARTGQQTRVEYRLQQPQGQLVHVVQVMEPMEPTPGEDAPQRWFSTLQDITEQKESELAMRRLNEELEQRVARRTSQLAEASAAAQRASEAKSMFLSRMSHELRTPMNAVIGFAQLLAAPGFEASREQQVAYSRHILQAGEHVLALVGELLDLAQIEAGKLALEMQPSPVGELLAECGAMVHAMAQARGIRCRIEPPPDPALQVHADRTRLKQVLLNLMSNGIKYNRPAGELLVSAVPSGHDRVRIEVRDTGHGLGPDQLGELFQPFNRLGHSRSTEEGTGLGLVVTRHLVEAMGGHIEVQSEPGVGTRFQVDLARAAGPQAGLGRGSHQEAPLPRPTPPRGTQPLRTVLCVEDDVPSLQLLQHLIGQRPGIELLTATNGRDGVALARQHRPDLILMDNHMPEMNGDEARATLAADPRTSAIPIIALSAALPSGEVPEAPGGGPQRRQVAKPFDPDKLLRAIDDALGG